MRKLAILLLLALPVAAQEPVDLGVVDRIKTEAFDHSKVMEILRQISDVHGPRLTGSPGFEDAARWAMTHDVSDGFKMVLTDLLNQMGYESVAKNI